MLLRPFKVALSLVVGVALAFVIWLSLTPVQAPILGAEGTLKERSFAAMPEMRRNHAGVSKDFEYLEGLQQFSEQSPSAESPFASTDSPDSISAEPLPEDGPIDIGPILDADNPLSMPEQLPSDVSDSLDSKRSNKYDREDQTIDVGPILDADDPLSTAEQLPI